jgi:AcrR family transcriptional regulator
VRHVIAVAGVSRRTFYEHFDNLVDAFRAAYDDAFERFFERIAEAWEIQADWPKKVAAAIVETLELAAAEPVAARLVSIEAVASGSALAGHHYRSLERLAPALRRGRGLHPRGEGLPALTERALLGAVCSLVAARLREGREAELPALAAEATQFVLTPYLGLSEAKRVAAAPQR